jgi:hypothetical protein
MELSHIDHWWGHFTIEEQKAAFWQVGPLSLWVQRLNHEWRIAFESNAHNRDLPLAIHTAYAQDDLLAKTNPLRFGLSKTSNAITLTPTLADRPVVVRPEKPLQILPQDTVRIYVSTPVWVRIEAGDPARALTEIPSARPSDTWFGPNTMEGELCYASSAFCRLRAEDIHFRANRAITQVSIDNQATTPLLLESLNLPVVYLSLYHHRETHYLWTESVRLVREEGDKLNPVTLDASPPQLAGICEKLQGPRVEVTHNLLTRAFKNLF